MTRQIKFIICGLIWLAVAAPHTDVGAQFPGGGGKGGMDRGMGGPKGGPKPDAPPITRRHLPDEIDYRLFLLEEDLRLTREQEPFWARYAETVRRAARDLERDRTRNDIREKLAVLERIDRIVEASRNRLTALEDISASARSFYQTLTPPQQQISDPRLATIAALLIEVAPQPPAAAPVPTAAPMRP